MKLLYSLKLAHKLPQDTRNEWSHTTGGRDGRKLAIEIEYDFKIEEKRAGYLVETKRRAFRFTSHFVETEKIS